MPLPPLTPEEIERRFPVWRAFSDLFLDTDPAFHYDSIVRAMRESPYTREQLHAILLEEVTPAFRFNLSIVTGEWAMWPDDYIRRRMLGMLRRPHWLRRLLEELPSAGDTYSAEQWQKLIALSDSAVEDQSI